MLASLNLLETSSILQQNDCNCFWWDRIYQLKILDLLHSKILQIPPNENVYILVNMFSNSKYVKIYISFYFFYFF